MRVVTRPYLASRGRELHEELKEEGDSLVDHPIASDAVF